jgi:hypothetical protein
MNADLRTFSKVKNNSKNKNQNNSVTIELFKKEFRFQIRIESVIKLEKPMTCRVIVDIHTSFQLWFSTNGNGDNHKSLLLATKKSSGLSIQSSYR